MRVSDHRGRVNGGLSVHGSVADTSDPRRGRGPLRMASARGVLVDETAAGGVDDDDAGLGADQRLLPSRPAVSRCLGRWPR